MEQEEIFSTIREKFYDKFGGNVPVFKILKAYGSQLVTPNLDGEWKSLNISLAIGQYMYAQTQ